MEHLLAMDKSFSGHLFLFSVFLFPFYCLTVQEYFNFDQRCTISSGIHIFSHYSHGCPSWCKKSGGVACKWDPSIGYIYGLQLPPPTNSRAMSKYCRCMAALWSLVRPNQSLFENSALVFNQWRPSLGM